MPKYSGFDPIESRDVVTGSTTFSGVEHAGSGGDTVLYLPFDDDVNDDSLFNQTITNRAYNGNPITVDSGYSKFGGKSLRSWMRSSLKIHNSSSMDLNTPFTVEFFFRNNQTLSNVALYTHNAINDSFSGLLFWIASDNTLRLYGSSNGGSWNIFQNPSTMGNISVNVWHHVAITYDGSTYRGYYDGVRKWARSSSTTLPTGGHSYILSRSEAGSYQTTQNSSVRMDDFRITKGVALYTGSTYTVPTSALGLHNGDPVSLYLPFDSDLNDNSSHSHTVTASGSAAISSTQSKFGGNSLSLNGTNQYLTVSNDAGFQFGSDDFTVEAWVYQTAAAGSDPSDRHAIVSRMASSSNRSWNIGTKLVSGEQRLQFGFTADGSSSSEYTFECDVTINTWHHIAVVRSGSGLYGFLNGKLLSSSVAGVGALGTQTIYAGTSDLAIGYRGLSTQYFEGYIDDLRISKGVARYTKNFIPPSQAVGATLNGKNETNTTTDFTSLYLPFDSDVNDDSPNSLSVTNNGATISSAQSKFGGYSALFDGSNDYIRVAYDDVLDFGTNDFTIEFWMYANTWNNNDTLYIHGTNQNSIQLFVPGTGSKQLYYNNNRVATVLPTQTVFSAGQWYHIALCRQGTVAKWFVNGVQDAVKTDDTSNWAGASADLDIGGDPTNNRYFDGYLDDFRIINGYAKYTADFVPPSSAVGTSVSETVNDLTTLYLPFDADVTTTTVPSSHVEVYFPFENDFGDDGPNSVTLTERGGGSSSGRDVYITSSYGVKPFGTNSAFFDNSSYSWNNTNSGNFTTTHNIDFSSNDFTIEFWAYVRPSQPNHAVLAQTYSSGGFFIQIDGNPSNGFRFGGGSADFSTSALTTNTWTHFAVERYGSTVTWYVDGSANVSTSISGTISVGGYLGLGSYQNGAGGFNGLVKDFRIINGTAVYKGNFSVPTAAHGGNGATTGETLQGGFEDQARNHSVTKNGDATLNTSVKKFGTSGLYLDGTGDYLSIPSNGDFHYGDDDFTIEMFVYMISNSSSSDPMNLISKWDDGQRSWAFELETSNRPRIRFSYDGSTKNVDTTLGTDVAPTASQWHHLAFVRSGATLTAYLDGTAGSTTIDLGTNSLASPTSSVYIGQRGSARYFNGYIDDLRIIKGLAKYTANFIAPTSALGSGVTDSTTTVTTETKTLSSTWTMTNDGSSPRSFIDMRSDNTWANNEHLQSQSIHRWNPANGGEGPGTTATGGSIATPGNGYRYHVFTSPGTFQLSAIDGGSPSMAVEYLVVAGGGGGGADRAGGGGAGGLRTNEDGNPKAGSAMTIATGSFPVVVGTGGSGGVWPSPTNSDPGGTSSFNSISATGGGNAGINGGGGPGGSGGGGTTHGYGGGGNGNAGGYTPPEGNDGGQGGYPRGGGGGGGAGAAGSNAPNPAGGNGGAGHSMPSFAGPILSPVIPGSMATAIGPTGLYAGGGGGGGQGSGNGGTGGPGGGGTGGKASVSPSSYNPTSGEYGPAGAPGVDGTGGGGGGAGNFPGTNPNMRPGGDGGNGVVIIKYAY